MIDISAREGSDNFVGNPAIDPAAGCDLALFSPSLCTNLVRTEGGGKLSGSRCEWMVREVCYCEDSQHGTGRSGATGC